MQFLMLLVVLFLGNYGQAFESAMNSGVDIAQRSFNHDMYISQTLAQVQKQEMLPNSAHMRNFRDFTWL